jgi:polyhydroxyalkanoate synthase
MWEDMFKLMNNTVAAIGQMQQATMAAAMQGMELTANTVSRMWGVQTEDVLSPDKRFQDAAWSDNTAADYMKQAYMITSQWMEGVADGLAPVDPTIHHRTKFWTKQLADALSPSNFVLTNPVVLQETIRTGGLNLVQGMQNLLSDMQHGRISQVPEGSFEVGVDLAITPGKVVYRNPLIEIIQYTPTTKKVHEIPMLMIPPWINKYYVMDMSEDNSMYRHLVEEGFTVFTISWKNPDETVLHLEWDDYMDLGTLEAIKVVKEITGAPRVNVVGYCLGGIIQQVTLGYLATQDDDSVNTATYFATHQDFTNAGDVTVFINETGANFLEWMMELRGGYLDGNNMAATFNMLRANDLLWNYVVHNYLLGKQPPEFDLLYWNADNTRIPGKVHNFLVREFFMKNLLLEPDGLQVKGIGVDLGRIKVPSYTVAATGDHIVPWEGTFLMRGLLGGPVRFTLTTGGHIAGIINPPAKSRRDYWQNNDSTEDPKAWLQGAEKTEGSWWPDWFSWLAQQSGEKIPTTSHGSDDYPILDDAPGEYVREK